MRITLDRARGTICGGGVVVAVDPAGEVLRPWLMAAIRQGWDFAERQIEMWDLGADQRREPMHCLTIISVARFLNPPKKKEPKRSPPMPDALKPCAHETLMCGSGDYYLACPTCGADRGRVMSEKLEMAMVLVTVMRRAGADSFEAKEPRDSCPFEDELSRAAWDDGWTKAAATSPAPKAAAP